MPTRSFTARYKQGVLFVSLPAIAASPLIGLAVFMLAPSPIAAAAASVLSIVLATMFLSARKRARPALTLSETGAEIDGLTVLDWTALERVRILPPYRENQAPGLELRFTKRPGWPQGFRPVAPSPLWRPLESGLFLRLWLLEDTPETIADAFNYFIRQRDAGA